MSAGYDVAVIGAGIVGSAIARELAGHRLTVALIDSRTDVGDGTPPLAGLLLRFSVSRDEEYVELVAVHERQLFDLQARSHHYALLLLAHVSQCLRKRLSQCARTDVFI